MPWSSTADSHWSLTGGILHIHYLSDRISLVHLACLLICLKHTKRDRTLSVRRPAKRVPLYFCICSFVVGIVGISAFKSFKNEYLYTLYSRRSRWLFQYMLGGQFSQVHARKVPGTNHALHGLLHMQQGVGILFGLGIETMKVDAKPERPILLSHQQHGIAPW